MRYVRRIITLHHRSGLAYRQIGKALGVPRSTVSDYIRRFKRSHLTLKDLKDKTDQELHRILFSDELKRTRGGTKPFLDFASIHQELKRKHVTRMLLWEEYREIDPAGYGYSSRLSG